MGRHDDEHSIYNEPHLNPGAARADPSEAKAAERLAKEAAQRGAGDHPGEGVYDEPDILPNRPDEIIERDWTCSECGYNLRGLHVGHPCPECGHRELYRPPPAGARSYETWLRDRIGRTPTAAGWVVAVVAAVGGGLLAIVAGLLHTNPGTLASLSVAVLVVVYGPAVEETMKIAAAAYVVETRPYLFRRIGQIHIATLGAALLFAVIENVIYLTVYISNPSVAIVLWRWTVCTAVHVGCTTVASRGLIEVWQRARTEFRQPRITAGLPTLVRAIVIHAGYNATMLGLELAYGSFP